jgi:hypothetical protein
VIAWLPAMTTLQALGVIVLGLGVGGFLPRYEIGAGFGLDVGGFAVGLGLGIAALSRKKPSRRERTRRKAQQTGG